MPGKKGVTTLDRFWAKVEKTEDCWLWTASQTHGGYGQFWNGEGREDAHRYSYRLHKGDIPKGLQLDHLCRVRHCVNPEHLEAVTCWENQRRGIGNTMKTHCIHGHEFTDENTYRDKRGRRHCIACRSHRFRKHRERAQLDAMLKSLEEKA